MWIIFMIQPYRNYTGDCVAHSSTIFVSFTSTQLETRCQGKSLGRFFGLAGSWRKVGCTRLHWACVYLVLQFSHRGHPQHKLFVFMNVSPCVSCKSLIFWHMSSSRVSLQNIHFTLGSCFQRSGFSFARWSSICLDTLSRLLLSLHSGLTTYILHTSYIFVI